MWKRQIIWHTRRPALAFGAAILFAAAALPLASNAVDGVDRLRESDDPVKITDRALDRTFNHDVAEREIRSALGAGDTDLAQSFIELAADRSVPVDPVLADNVRQARANEASMANTAGRFIRGFWTGVPVDLASLAGTAFGDLFVFGDIRDAAREGTHYLAGRKYDPWILGLAGAGIAITAATYATLGAGAPERVGVSLVKAARRTGRLNPVLATRIARDVVKVENAGGLVELGGDVGRIETRAGTQAALDSLTVAEEPEDVSRVARLAAAKGGKTRAIVKLLGRGAIMLTAGAFGITMWLFWTTLAMFGFLSSCKAGAERVTQRYLDRRKVRRAREPGLRLLAVPSRL
jgi:hypothetical protein